MKIILLSFILFLLSTLLSISANASTGLNLTLTPLYRNGSATGIAIKYDISLPEKERKDALLLLDNLKPLIRSSDEVSDLITTDDKGSLIFRKIKNRMVDGYLMQAWRASRQIVGPLHVSYHIDKADPLSSSPVKALQVAGGGLSGSFAAIFLTPDLPGPLKITLNWKIASTETAVSSFGVGNQSITVKCREFLSAQFIMGQLLKSPSSKPGSGLSIYGLGKNKTEFDQSGLWPRKIYEMIRRQLNGSALRPFMYFFRSYNGGPMDSGTATNGSFMLYIPEHVNLNDPDLASLSAHEMIHLWVPGLTAPPEREEWYEEGIADYLSITILHDCGFYSDKEFLQHVNHEAAEYYINRSRLVPDSGIPAVKWAGGNAWTLPYSRGMLYFADLNEKLKLHKAKAGSVLELIKRMNKLSASGKSITADTWKNLLKHQAGEWAVSDWENMENGQLVVPLPGAFGAKFKRIQIQTGIYDLGFEKPGSIIAGLKINGLIKHSSADSVGLREGDIIVRSVNLIPIYGSYNLPLTISVKRGDAIIPFTYQPRSGVAIAYKWILM